MFVLFAIPIGLALGLLTGGHLGALSTFQFRWPWVAVIGLIVQLAIFTDAIGTALGDIGPAIYIASTAAVLVAVLRNIATPGMAIIAIGAACNLAAIVANGGFMPADPAALRAAGLDAEGVTNSVVAADPALRPLTDIFAIPAAMPLSNVFSIGDVIIALGVVVTIALAMRREPVTRRRWRDGGRVTLPDLGSSLPEIVLRTAIVYLFLVIVLRLSGKRQVGQPSILELIVVLVISDAVQNSMVGDNTTLWGGMVAVLTLVALDRALGMISARSKRIRTTLEGEPRLVVRDGRILERALLDEDLTADDVQAAARAHGLTRVDEIRLGVLEIDGSISVIPFRETDRADG